MKNQTHLKSIKNGRVFLFSKTLATRDDMVPCNAKGEIASGHIADAESIDATQSRRETKFLGNVKNGVLYPYTKFLAERDDMVSIDTPEQWEEMRKTGEAPALAPDTVAPALQREPKEPAKTKTLNYDNMLPDIKGMGAREAKTILSNWAKEKFDIVLDRRPALAEVIAECNNLAKTGINKASGQ